uniref:ubiquitinyl hydrolase 1 n=1 Tax=Kwoniella dejecticola CBS 10117 TaxID=1296121 RepID=A0A1A5ZW67_9TREE|nr:uncharacterized protein I303_07969 [Kwoniella dejecticola CBS 10117]OBR82055.1 hypothetical protein I303_07969 [Kwoniella dejecticola CBS 10117]
MSRTPSLTSMPLVDLQSMAQYSEDIASYSPKEWFQRAVHEADLAVMAERSKKKEEMFLAYTRSCQAYNNCRMHPASKDLKKSDPHWHERVKDFKETYDAFLNKGKDIKEQLKKRDARLSYDSMSSRPGPSRSESGPDIRGGGSIADRMKALGGHGMDVGNSSKRFSKDLSPASTPLNRPSAPPANATPKPKESVQSNGTGTSAGGNMGSLRTTKPAGNRQRSESSSSATVRPSATGSSTRSRRSTNPTEVDRPLPIAPINNPISNPANTSTNPPLNAGPSKPPLPPIPSTLTNRNLAAQKQADNEADTSSGTLKDFEKAFPSLSDFGKQFQDDDDDLFTQHNPTIEENGEHSPEIQLPDVPSFPNLPSAPSDRPGRSASPLPPPPRRPDRINTLNREHSGNGDHDKALSPPMPDAGAGLKRPARNLPNGVVRDDAPNGVTRDTAPSAGLKDGISPTLSFPVATPTPPQASPRTRNSLPHPPSLTPQPPPQQANGIPHSQEFKKPKFPFSNSVTPDELRSYFLNPAVDILLLDVRSEEEYKRGHVGREYEPRGAKVTVVWMDPTVLMRDGINSQKLEDSLSLSPPAQQKAFSSRNTYDLLVVYDSNSSNWPTKDQKATPASRLWESIYQYEFTAKKLERTPVLLVGGYEAWREFIKMRASRHQQAYAAQTAHGQGHGHGHSQSVQVNGQGRPCNPKANGYTHSPTTTRLDRVTSPNSSVDLTKRANRDMPVYQSAHYAKNITDSFGYAPQSMTGEPSSYISGQPSRSYAPSPISHTRSPSNYSSSATPIAAPPQASIHPGPGARRRSDYLDQHGQTYSGSALTTAPSPRPAIDYPQAHALSSANLAQPPPAAINPMDRYDTRPAVVRSGSIRGLDLVAREGDEVRYWNDVVLGLTGLKNLGNTCYMNSTLQCLSATYPFTSFFLDGSYKRSINLYNPLGTKGNLANAFAELLKALWKEDYTFLSPVTFRKNIITFASQFSGTDQHDSQEFLSFVLDGLHEDLNRVKHKPPPVDMTPEREAALESLPPAIASEKEWQIYQARNDSFIVDLFQGQYRNRLECLTCHKTSTTYDTFMYMSLPVPSGKSKVVVQELIDEFVKAEVMEKEDAWNCPRCKVPRKATKTLTISRLPPVLLIQLKRFTTQNGVFWDKSETPVIFPVKSLDLTRYVPARQPTGKEDLDDPRCQIGPFKYDLYGVSNHMGTLSSGHYTAYVKSSKGWMYCEDSKVSKAHEKDVVSRPAYILIDLFRQALRIHTTSEMKG